MGDVPYPSLTLAVVESEHSRRSRARRTWRSSISRCRRRRSCGGTIRPPSTTSPISSSRTKLAHQWWGQAVGWKNYHEQWLSEGFAQYFAALYAEHQRGPQVFQSLLRRCSRSGA